MEYFLFTVYGVRVGVPHLGSHSIPEDEDSNHSNNRST